MKYLYLNKMVRIDELLQEKLLLISDDYRSEVIKDIIQIGNIEKKFIELCDGANNESKIFSELNKYNNVTMDDMLILKNFFMNIGLLEESTGIVENHDPVYRYNKPFEIIFDITGECNCNCLYCLNNSGRKANNELTFEQIKTITEQIKKIRPNLVTIGGGEPVLREKELLYIINELSKEKINHVLFTNSTLITDEISQRLKDAGLKAIRTSIDGHVDWLHDKLRNKEGCLKATLNGIDSLRKQNVTICVSSTISLLNYEYMHEIKAFISKIGDYANMYPVNPLGRGKVKPYLLSNEQYQNFLKCIFSNADGEIDFASYPKERCLIGEALFISPNGNIYPCWTLAHDEFIIGNATSNNLSDLYSSSELLKSCLDLNVHKLSHCNDCNIKYICGGGCRGNSYSLSNNLFMNDITRCVPIRNFTNMIGSHGTEDAKKRLADLCTEKETVVSG